MDEIMFRALLCLVYFCTVFEVTVSTEELTSRAYIWGLRIFSGPKLALSGKAQLQNVTGGQKIKFDIFMKQAADDNNKWQIRVLSLNASKPRQIFQMKGKGLCSSLNEHGSTFWMLLERMVGVASPGTCPIPKNTYKLNWMTIPYEKVKFNNKPAIEEVAVGRYFVQAKLLDTTEKFLKGGLTFHFTKVK